MSFKFLVLFLFAFFGLNAQFAPPAGQSGSSAVAVDSSIIIAWAVSCAVESGPVDISQPALGLVNSGTASDATGQGGEGASVSLGDGGSAVLTFEYPLRDGMGADFLVFENSFNATFLELAFVEVSSDGINFVRFPSISETDTSVQVGPFGAVDATKIHNLAGKYKANFGTPFDLNELVSDSAVLDINKVTHVRIVDAVGSIQSNYASRDSRGVIVNDPWSTPFPSGGFDLDAVGVIHQKVDVSLKKIPDAAISIFPNPVIRGNMIRVVSEMPDEFSLNLYNAQGVLLFSQLNISNQISTENLLPGCYFLTLKNNLYSFVKKILIR